MNKKILISLSVIGAVSAIAIGGTIAYFSDTETSTGNTFVAGTLDLKVDSKCTWNGIQQEGCTWLEPKNLSQGDLFFNFNDVKPGDTGEDTISLHIYDNDAYVCAGISNLKNEENGCNNPEKIAEPNCETDNIGELQNNLLFTIWKDSNCDNILQAGEQVLVDNQPAANGYWPIADSNTGGPLAGDTTACVGLSWRIPGNVGNEIQTDKLSADISFDAIQARNLPQFICTSQGACAPQTEMCNGKDDDCDGQVDEGWTLGGECSTGLGACHAAGTYVCNPASPFASAICSAVASQPSSEICTGGVDEDCDGYIDCGDSDCANNAACQTVSNDMTVRLENKNVNGDWSAITGDGIYGDLTYNPSGPTFDYSFAGHGLTSGTSYSLIYYADCNGAWPCGAGITGSTGALLGSGIADVSGNLNLSTNMELNSDLPNPDDQNYPGNGGVNGAKIWLVLSVDYNTASHKVTGWQPASYLFDTQFISYDDTDVASPETIALTDLGAASQYGYYHNYAGANVSFQYITPATGKLTGTITAIGLKPYATYQLKFNGKPTCQYGAAGNDVLNEQVGYMGRWWDNTTNSNTNDAGYLANSIYHGGTHCISGYLVWGYITADATGAATKIVTTDSSYHVLFCSGGTCGQSNNNQLAFLDPARPALNLCSAGNVNGQIERGSCGSMTFASGTYKLGMILNEESFHMGPGTWTAVMDGDIEFNIN